MHFGQMSIHAPRVKSYSFSDKQSEEFWNFKDHNLVCYEDGDPYWKQYTECLDSVAENYVIYLQEDFILYSDIDYEKIEKYVTFLERSEFDYVRLIRCGYNTPLDQPLGDNLYAVNMSSSDAFSMQATLWKKSRLRDLYLHVKSQKWLESESWNEGARSLGIRGAFTYHGEKKIGAFHYDSIVYPYVCTAINRGKWNIDQYPEVMRNMFQSYSIDPKIRGIRER
jgi:hypothetical protein